MVYILLLIMFPKIGRFDVILNLNNFIIILIERRNKVMANDIIQQITDLATTSLNVPLIIVLLGVGAFLKHAIKKLNNDYIPCILGVLSVVLVIVMNIPFNPQEKLLSLLVEAIVAVAAALLVHAQGKTLLADFVARKNNTGPGDTEADQAQEDAGD